MIAPRKNWLEWTVFAAGLLLLIATTGYLGYQALVHGQPAALRVTLGTPWTPDDDHPARVVVPVTVHNDGGQTAAEVKIEVSVVRGGDDRSTRSTSSTEPLERRELTFTFVPHMSSRSGALTFEHRPAPEELHAQVLSYLEPRGLLP